MMIETQIAKGIRRGDFEPYIGGGERKWPEPLHVAVIDIGRADNTGWAIDGPTPSQGKSIDECVDALAVALDEGALALGFEAPMFVPLHRDAKKLTRARNGESNRAFTAGAGSAALVCGLVVVPYVLKKLRERAPTATATLDWKTPLDGSGHILLFEAFVSHQPKGDDGRHIRDALLAIEKFREGMGNPAEFQSAINEQECLNLVGAALLRTGWTTDINILSQPCLVVRQKGGNGAAISSRT
jgi:hypothetical protein